MRSEALTPVFLVGLLVAACGQPPPPPATVCSGHPAGELVITELMLDPEGSDTGAEWIELYNPQGAAVDLKGMTLYTKSVSGGSEDAHVIRAGTIWPGRYFVAGDVRSGPFPAWVSYSYEGDLGSLSQTGGIVGIRCGTEIIDEVKYTLPGKSARSRMLNQSAPLDATSNDAEFNWCDTSSGKVYGGGNAGTPGSPNGFCEPEATLGTCVDPDAGVRTIVPPKPGELLITEIMASPKAASDATGEWIELLATASVDLNDLYVTSGTSKSRLSDPTCMRVAAGEYVVLARSVDPFLNGDLPAPRAKFSLGLSATNEKVGLWFGDAGIDIAAVAPSSEGISWQLDPTMLNGAANDVPDNFCKATARWAPDGGGDLGTPAKANTACPPRPDGGVDGGVGPGQCVDRGTGTPRSIVSPAVGELVITELMADPVAVADSQGEYVEVLAKAAVDVNGVSVVNDSGGTSTLTSTDCLRVAAGSYFLVARSLDASANGGLPPVLGTFAFDIVNSGSRHVAVKLGATELDRLAYSSTTAGASLQLTRTKTSAADNDDPLNLCATPTSARFGGADGGAGDRGTPGAANAVCP